MKSTHFCLLIMIGLFVLTGCEVETKNKHKKGDFITGGKDYSVTEGFPDAPAPEKNSGKNNQ